MIGFRQFKYNACKVGFTLIEMMVVVGLLAMSSVLFHSFVTITGASLRGIVDHCQVNNDGGYATQYLTELCRKAHDYSISADGRSLTLNFDDDAETDSNGDGDAFNDDDRIEIIRHDDNADELIHVGQKVICDNVTGAGVGNVFSANPSEPKLVSVKFIVSIDSADTERNLVIEQKLFLDNS